MRTNRSSQTKPVNQMPDGLEQIKKLTALAQKFVKKGGAEKNSSGVADLLKLNSEFNLKNGKRS